MCSIVGVHVVMNCGVVYAHGVGMSMCVCVCVCVEVIGNGIIISFALKCKCSDRHAKKLQVTDRQTDGTIYTAASDRHAKKLCSEMQKLQATDRQMDIRSLSFSLQYTRNYGTRLRARPNYCTHAGLEKDMLN